MGTKKTRIQAIELIDFICFFVFVTTVGGLNADMRHERRVGGDGEEEEDRIELTKEN